MKICLIAQCEPSLHQGGGKAQYFLSHEWRKMGHTVEVFGRESLAAHLSAADGKAVRPETAAQYLINTRHEDYDIIDYDHSLEVDTLPANSRCLFVARSVLFLLHSWHIVFPLSRRWKHRLKRGMMAIPHALSAQARSESRRKALALLGSADLLNLSNSMDRDLALRYGFPESQLAVFPFALGSQPVDLPIPDASSKKIIFLGSFDFRKGCYDTAAVFHAIRNRHPHATLTLLGAQGVFTSREEILQTFHRLDRSHVQVILRFSPQDLARHLTDARLAIFPSYLEGFGFSVLETLAAGIPTLAYNSPGPCDILPTEWLTNPGQPLDLAAKALTLFNTPPGQLAKTSRLLAARFSWPDISARTIERYKSAMENKLKRLAFANV